MISPKNLFSIYKMFVNGIILVLQSNLCVYCQSAVVPKCKANLFAPGVKPKTEVVDNKDGTYTVTYVPLTSGMYTLLLKYGGKAVPGFPAKVTVDPAVDTSKVKVFGPGVEGQGAVQNISLQRVGVVHKPDRVRVCLNTGSSLLHPSGVFREATTEFTVDARSLTQRGGDHIKAEVKNPSGALTDCSLTDNADGTYGVEYTPFENGNTPLAHGGPKDLLSRFTDAAVFCFVFFCIFRHTQRPSSVR